MSSINNSVSHDVPPSADSMFRRKHSMLFNTKPVGYYIYSYIRSKDSTTAKAGMPYYIGKGTRYRAWNKDHNVNVPKNQKYILIIEQNLTEIGALALERRMIRWYGRKNNNTGILLNRTDGGEGASGHKASKSTRKKLSKYAKNRTPTHLANLSKSLAGKIRGIKGAPKWSKCCTLEEFKNMLLHHINNNLSDPEIGKIFNISATIIWDWKKKLKIANRRNNLRNYDWLYDHYVNKKLSTGEISNILNCSSTAVWQYLVKYNIPIRDAITRQKNVDPNRKKFPAKDKDGNLYLINQNDLRYKSGELVGWAKGRVSKNPS